MKFTVMYKDCDAVVAKFHEYLKTGYGNGARLKELRKYDVLDTNTGNIVGRCLGYCCEGSWLSYMYHKRLFRKVTTVVKGWGQY
nr:MAG TPA: hypothetical protein [Caudoviricetes sp.]